MKMVVVEIGGKQFCVWYILQGINFRIVNVLNENQSGCRDWFTQQEITEAMAHAGVTSGFEEPKKENWFKKFWRENFSVKSF